MDTRKRPENGVAMARTVSKTITISPPNLARTGFLTLAQELSGAAAPSNRDWLLQRFEEGYQVRMLRPPARGYIEFAPGRASWRALNGADRCVVVQCLYADGPEGAADLLWAAEEWARYYDFAAIMVLVGPHPCLCAPDLVTSAGYSVIDQTQCVSLFGKVLQGPLPLPALPQNWAARQAALGPGLVVQCPARSEERLAFARDLVAQGEQLGLCARIGLIETAAAARKAQASPTSPFSVVLNGQAIDDGQLTDFQILQALRQRAAPGHRQGTSRKS